MKNIINKVLILGMTFAPAITYAETKDLRYLIGLASGYLKDAMYLIIALAVVMFVWNVFQYFIKSDDVAEKKEAAQYVMWSVIGFFVILSLWGLVNIVKKTFNLEDNVPSSGLFGNFKTSGNGFFDGSSSGSGSTSGGGNGNTNGNGGNGSTVNKFDQNYNPTSDPIKTD